MTLFFEIEKQFVFNKYKNINYEALEFEFKFYSEGYNYDPELFNLISKIIYEEIKKDKNIFKLENNYLKNILKICTFMLNTLNKEICVNKFCADILTN